jgi:hypothetical protein
MSLWCRFRKAVALLWPRWGPEKLSERQSFFYDNYEQLKAPDFLRTYSALVDSLLRSDCTASEVATRYAGAPSPRQTCGNLLAKRSKEPSGSASGVRVFGSLRSEHVAVGHLPCGRRPVVSERAGRAKRWMKRITASDVCRLCEAAVCAKYLSVDPSAIGAGKDGDDAGMASRRTRKKRQGAKFVIFVADVSDVRFGASLATSQ